MLILWYNVSMGTTNLKTIDQLYHDERARNKDLKTENKRLKAEIEQRESALGLALDYSTKTELLDTIQQAIRKG